MIQGDIDGARKLREFLRVMQRLPYVCLIPAALIILPSLVTQHDVPPSLPIVATAIVAGAWSARIWYRLHPDSMNAIFLLNFAGMLLLMTGFLIGMWEARRFSRLAWLFTEYLPLYVIFFVALSSGMSLLWVARARGLREMYQSLQPFLPGGVITDDEFWHLMFPARSGASLSELSWKLGGASGFAVCGTLLASGLGGRDGVGYFYFLLFLLIDAFLLSSVIARCWAHRKYLGGRDLRIIWTRTP